MIPVKLMMSKSDNKKVKNKVLLTSQIYTEFYPDDVKTDKIECAYYQKALKTVYENTNRIIFGDLTDGSNPTYSRVGVVNYDVFRRVKEDSESVKRELIYRVDKVGDRYRLVAGKYCGYIGLKEKCGKKNIQIKIECGFSDRFFKRILDFCCGIYVNDSPIGGAKTERSIYSLLVQYMFLVSLRKTINKGLPKKYAVQRERGYDIKGNVDIETYVNSDFVVATKTPYFSSMLTTSSKNSLLQS